MTLNIVVLKESSEEIDGRKALIGQSFYISHDAEKSDALVKAMGLQKAYGRIDEVVIGMVEIEPGIVRTLIVDVEARQINGKAIDADRSTFRELKMAQEALGHGRARVMIGREL